MHQDYKMATQWYAEAAEQGLEDAQFYLGEMYTQGEGISEDYSQALRWWRLAAAQGNERARKDHEI